MNDLMTPFERRKFIAQLRESGMPVSEIAKEFGVSRSRIYELCRKATRDVLRDKKRNTSDLQQFWDELSRVDVRENVSHRTLNLLICNGIDTIGKLLLFDPENVTKFKQAGKKIRSETEWLRNRLISEITNADSWFDATKDFPKGMEYVLGVCENDAGWRKVRMCQYISGFNDPVEGWSSSDNFYRHVIAWRPLPHAPCRYDDIRFRHDAKGVIG